MTLSTVIEALRQFYGRLPEPPRDPFSYFVWHVLSAETAPAKRDAAFAALKKIPALTPDAMWRGPQGKIEAAVAAPGPYREQRLQALRAGVDRFRRTPGLGALIRGPLPAARRALGGLPRPGEPDARRMLLFTAGRLLFPVDARVARVAVRLGYGQDAVDPGRRARTVQRALSRELDPDAEAFRRTFLYLSHHGSATCIERSPHCSVCPLIHGCPYGQREIADFRLQISD